MVSNVSQNRLKDKTFIYLLLLIFHIGLRLDRARIWQLCLSKLYQLDRSATLRVCYQQLEINEFFAPMRYFLEIAADDSGYPYREALSMLAGAAPHYSPPVRNEIETFVQSEAQQQPSELAAIAIVTLAKLNPSSLLHLCDTQQTSRIKAWRIALGQEDRRRYLFVFLYGRLSGQKTQHWKVVCKLISQITQASGGNISRAEQPGVSQARNIVARAVVSGNAEVRQETAYILAQVAPENNWQILADLLVEQLNGKLQDLLDHDQAIVREMVHRTFLELHNRFLNHRQLANGRTKSRTLQSRIRKMLRCAFRTGRNEAITEALDTLVKLSPKLVTAEAFWVAQKGKKDQVEALLRLTNNTAYCAAVRGLVAGCLSENQNIRHNAASQVIVSVRSYIVNSLMEEIQKNSPQRAPLAIIALIKLDPSALISSYVDQSPPRITVWRTAFAEEPHLISIHFYKGLLNDKAIYWDDICDLTLRIASTSDENISSKEQAGANQMCEVLASVIATSSIAQARQRTARILVQAASETGWQILANVLRIEHLESLQDLLDDEWPVVRTMIRRTLREMLNRFPDLQKRVLAMLSLAFRTARDEASIEALVDLIQLDPQQARDEAKWAAHEGREHHVKALLQLDNETAYVATIQGLVDACPLDNNRVAFVWLWLLKHQQTSPPRRAARALNALALIDRDRTRDHLHHHLNDWRDVIHKALEYSARSLLDILWELVETTDIRQDILDLLTDIAQVVRSNLRESILELFYKGLEYPDVMVWKPCLYKLILLGELLQIAEDYSKDARRLPSDVYSEVVKSATEEALKRPLTEAATVAVAQILASPVESTIALKRPVIPATTAMIALAYLSPEKLRQIYRKRQKDGITKTFLELAEQNNALRRHIIITFSVAFYIDVSQDLFEELITGQLKLEDWLFPFNMRVATTTNLPIHIEELAKEPDTYIAASQISVWIYRQSDEYISDLVIAGQANSSICKQVSAKILTAYLIHLRDTTNEALATPGAIWIQNTRFTDQSSLEELIQQLDQLEKETGLVQIRNCWTDYNDIRHELYQHIKQVVQSRGPKLLHRSNPLEDCAFFMPFYILNGDNNDELETLSFELDFQLFRWGQPDDVARPIGDELRYELGRAGMVLKAHRREMVHKIHEDAKE